jgi:prepilin-type N-terminal cleavage/methylation domain-containing protein
MNSTKTLSSQQRGVTLIEASFTLAIAGILADSALPSFKESLDTRKVEGFSSEVGTDLR